MEATAKIEKWLTDNGYKLGSYGSCQHSCGIPANASVFVAPNWSPVDGDHALAITPTEVIQVTVRIPYNFNDWREQRRWTYSSQEELKKILDQMVKQPAGCWK